MPRTDHLLRRVRRALRRISPLTPPAIPPAAPAINRTQRLLSGLDRSMALIEVGPSHAPLAPKRDGWRTTVVDHASRQDLARKYANQQLDVDRIEEVDVIWSGGDLASKFPPEALGSYDAILASHVMEHMPDPISFLISAQRLLKPAGRVILALPDRRYTFDYFEPMTTTADWLIAHENRAHTHSKRAAFNHMAYHVTNDAQATWRHSQNPVPALTITITTPGISPPPASSCWCWKVRYCATSICASPTAHQPSATNSSRPWRAADPAPRTQPR